MVKPMVQFPQFSNEDGRLLSDGDGRLNDCAFDVSREELEKMAHGAGTKWSSGWSTGAIATEVKFDCITWVLCCDHRVRLFVVAAVSGILTLLQ